MFSLKKVHGKVLKLPATTQWESMETTFITGNDTDLKIKKKRKPFLQAGQIIHWLFSYVKES